MSARIQLNDLTVVLGTGNRAVEALREINLTVEENEFLCVMGPSGCGKTTLLNVIAGFVPATAGSAMMNNARIAGPGKDRAVVFQSDAVFPWMTVEQNIAYSGRFAKMSRKERKRAVEAYLDLVGLREFRKAWPKELSGGMRKRVDVARAYFSEPEVLLMDEPFGELDIMTKERMQTEFLAIWERRPKTVVFITHDLEEGLFLGDRLIVMAPRPGRIIKTFQVPFGRPRQTGLKTEEEFVQARRSVKEYFDGTID
ncbi:MAG: ABC transporter ATP-binding protein [Rhodospirillales bacterium]|nr:ABC transporter ATP-binding protein [Rhodospirillales bacterium]MDE0381433.1 ABC transporter ATP-binding protein [Rhodospirillales bacterium]